MAHSRIIMTFVTKENVINGMQHWWDVAYEATQYVNKKTTQPLSQRVQSFRGHTNNHRRPLTGKRKIFKPKKTGLRTHQNHIDSPYFKQNSKVFSRRPNWKKHLNKNTSTSNYSLIRTDSSTNLWFRRVHFNDILSAVLGTVQLASVAFNGIIGTSFHKYIVLLLKVTLFSNVSLQSY